MPRNKHRLQLALYARPKHPGSYHYAFFIAPKSGSGQVTKYHVKNTFQQDASGSLSAPWRYETTTIADVAGEQRLLVRVVIAKVLTSIATVEGILQNVPVYQVDQADEAKALVFSCRTWISSAFEELVGQGAVSGRLEDWSIVQRKALEYVESKREQKRWDKCWRGGIGVPLMDLLDNRELVA